MTSAQSSAADDRREHGRRRSRRNETRDALLHTMRELLDSGESLTQISVERLATATGMSRTRFYMYFEDLGDLLYSAYAVHVADGKHLLVDWWSTDGFIERAQMRRILGDLVRYRAKHIHLSRAMHACAVNDPNARRSLENLRQESISELHAAVRAGQANGAIDDALDAKAISGWLGWLLERGVDQLVGEGGPSTLRRVADSLTAIIWNTLYGATPSTTNSASRSH